MSGTMELGKQRLQTNASLSRLSCPVVVVVVVSPPLPVFTAGYFHVHYVPDGWLDMKPLVGGGDASFGPIRVRRC